MLALTAAQLKFKKTTHDISKEKPIWVDFGGGTGWNIEAMQTYVDVPSFFSQVYLVDLSPSLCGIAEKRFARLGWKNVTVVCQDARMFRLPYNPAQTQTSYMEEKASDLSELKRASGDHADLITLSYSLSMIPDYYSVVDSIASLLHEDGLLGVVDFYVQSIVETAGRNYIGGSLQRHVNWLGRSFWRAWFDLDRVGLEGAKRVSQGCLKLAQAKLANAFRNRTIWNIDLEHSSRLTKETIFWVWVSASPTTSTLGLQNLRL